MHRILLLLISCLLLPIVAAGQATTRIAIRAGRLIDGRGEKPLENPLIQVEGGKIISVTTGGSAPSGMEVVDLANATLLPGFIDVHTHLLFLVYWSVGFVEQCFWNICPRHHHHCDHD